MTPGAVLRGLRAAPSRELVDVVRSAYGIQTVDAGVDLGGSSNLNLLLGDGDDRWVVRAYRPHVTADRLPAIHVVRHELAEAGLPCGGLVRTRDGRPWVAFEGRLVEVERYVEHDANMDCWDRLEAGASLLGRIHVLLRDVEVGTAGRTPMFANHIEPNDTLEATRQAVR